MDVDLFLIPDAQDTFFFLFSPQRCQEAENGVPTFSFRRRVYRRETDWISPHSWAWSVDGIDVPLCIWVAVFSPSYHSGLGCVSKMSRNKNLRSPFSFLWFSSQKPFSWLRIEKTFWTLLEDSGHCHCLSGNVGGSPWWSCHPLGVCQHQPRTVSSNTLRSRCGVMAASAIPVFQGMLEVEVNRWKTWYSPNFFPQFPVAWDELLTQTCLPRVHSRLGSLQSVDGQWGPPC